MNTLLSASACAEIEKWLKKYPTDQRRSALLQALMIVQTENNGWLSNELIEAVAEYLQIPAMDAFEVAKFYSMYELKPVGKHKICVCTNISCLLRGSENIVAHLEDRLHIKMGQTTPDGQYTLRSVECLAACANAPMMQIGAKYYEDLTPKKVDEILDSLE